MIKILNELLNKLEKGQTRLTIKGNEDKLVAKEILTADGLIEYLDTINYLNEQNIVTITWKKGERGQIVDKITLSTSPESLKRAYQLCNRTPIEKQLEVIKDDIRSILNIIQTDWIKDYLTTTLNKFNETNSIHHPWKLERNANSDLLKALKETDSLKGDILIRKFSSNAYGDSKYFTKHVQSRFVTILKAVFEDVLSESTEGDSTKALLNFIGITNYPEQLEIRGNIVISDVNSHSTDFTNFPHGALLNSHFIKDITEIKGKDITKVLFIENLANYHDYISKNHNKYELVIYHGGFYSPIKGLFFKKIYKYLSKNNEVTFQHWSDIDLGGFKIFCRLRDNIIPELQPYKMNIEVFNQFKEVGQPITKISYLTELEKLLSDECFEIFYSLINMILETKIKIEQEALIN